MKDARIPLSILIGAAFIAAAIYFGLRHSPPAAPAATAHSAAPDNASAPVSPTPAPVATAAPVPAAEASSKVSEAIAALKPALIEKCWKPALKKSPTPASIPLTWDGTIGKDGVATAFGITEDREANRPEVAECVREEMTKLKLPPQPASFRAEVRFELP